TRGDRYLAEVPVEEHRGLHRLGSFVGAGLRVRAGSDAPERAPAPGGAGAAWRAPACGGGRARTRPTATRTRGWAWPPPPTGAPRAARCSERPRRSLDRKDTTRKPS